MKKFFIDNGLSIALFGLFFIFLIGLSVTGWSHYNEELALHNESAVSYVQYLRTGDFGEAVFENWESEFLQMGALVVLTIWLHQKGSRDSKKMRGHEAVDTRSRYSVLHASSWRKRKKAIKELFYANSLSLALFAIFLLSFILHAVTGVIAYNQEAVWNGEPQLSVWQYTGSSTFWFESFQNWQSEFLAVGALIVLSIFLRQRHSPQSKPIGESNAVTGGE